MRPCIRFTFLLLALPLFLNGVKGQYNQTETFTFADGLAMTECSQLYCDRAGLLWIQHTTGWLSCFDGKAFTKYSPAQMGSQGDGTQFMEDKYGLWVLRHHSISLFDSKAWKTWTIPDATVLCLDKEADQVVLVDRENHLLKLDSLQGIWKIYASLPVQHKDGEYKIMYSRFENKYLLIQFDPSGNWKPQKAFFSTSLLYPHWKEDAGYLHPGPEWAFLHVVPPMNPLIEAAIPISSPSQSQLLTTSRNRLLYAQSVPDQASHKFIFKIYGTREDQAFTYLASFMNGHKNISIAFDRMGNIWVASHSGLVRIFPNILQCFDELKNMVPSLHVINEDEKGRIWFGGYTTGLAYFENNRLYSAPPEAARYKGFLPGYYTDRKREMAFWTEDYFLVHYRDGIWSDSRTEKGEAHREVGYNFLPISNDRIAAGIQNYGMGITKLPLTAHADWTYIGKEKGMLLDHVLTITEDPKGRLWLGRPSQGVAVYDPASDTARTWLIEQDSLMEYAMMSSVLDKKGKLWMGCMDGLYVMEDPGAFDLFKDTLHSKVHKISMEEAGNSKFGFLALYHEFLVIGNQAGYGFLDLNSYDEQPLSPRIYFFPTAKFGLSMEQNAVLIDAKDFIWIGQDHGAARIDIHHPYLDSLPVYLSPKILVVSNPDGDTSEYHFDSLNHIRLPLGRRNITVTIASNFTGWLNNNVGIQYRLVHNNTKDASWSPYTRHFDIRLDYLPPGKNRLEVRAIKNNQVVSQTEFTIKVPYHIYETFTFWFGLFALLSIAVFLITRHVFRQRLQLRLTQINLAEQNREKNQFQISAIANALNPHFIKNTLAWMQSRFRKDEQVVDVIDRLAFNISSVFLHSRKGEVFHTLEEELKVLDNFLSIQLAIYGPFMEITLPEEKDWLPWREVLVPLLQIQIHAENAIEHGLRNKPTGKKLLRIAVRERDARYIEVSIEDNGIGRVAARERGSRGSRQGTMMLDRVYELYNQHNADHFQTLTEDLYDPDSGNAAGTRVIIIIPKKYKLDLT